MDEQEYLPWWADRNAARQDGNVTTGNITLMVRKNVFSPDPEMTNSTSLALKHLPDVRGKSVLDIGTGSGILGSRHFFGENLR